MKTPASAIALLAALALLASGPARATATNPVLSVRVSGDSAGSVTSQPPGIDCRYRCSAHFIAAAADATVTLTATAGRVGSVFIGWTGACDGIAPRCTVTMDAAKSVEAVFADIGDTVQAVSAGYYHACALTSTGAVWCWGGNDYGQVGDGTTTQRLTPVPVSGLSSGVRAISAGDVHTCAVTVTGTAWCWGYNEYGRLGDGTEATRLTPVAVSGLSGSVQAISAGAGHTCALTGASAAWCWGMNVYGELGDGTTTARLTPVPVSDLSGVQTISAGSYHTCASTSAGAAWCWGQNAYGRLGDGTTTDRSTPVAVSGLSSGVQAISTGGYHTCATISAGAAWCWGNNEYGQLGDGTMTNRLAPVAVSGLSSGVHAIAAGQSHTCASTSAGAAWCWGLNTYGQLGIGGTIAQRSTPTAVVGLSSGVQTISAGSYHTCASTGAGAAWCWGRNDVSQLGDGTTTQRLAPVLVIEPPSLIFRNGFD